MGDRKSRQVIILIKIIITCTDAITGLTVASHPQRCFLVTVKISPYKKKSPAKWKTIAISLPDNFIRSRSLPVFVLVLRLWRRHSLPKGKLTRMTRWLSKHQRLRFMRTTICRSEILASGSGYYPHDDGDF